MEQVDKKDLTQGQIETILKGQFNKTQSWQTFFLVIIVAIPIGLLTLWGFGDVNILIRIAVYGFLGVALAYCERWVVERRIEKTIQAMRDM
jgi:hypothetical protein